MFLCYVDESGYNGSTFNHRQPVQLMVGVMINLYNYHKTHNEFQKIFKIIKTKIPIKELKAEEIYRGKKVWENIKPESRDAIIQYYLKWVTDRPSVRFIITAIDNKKFFELKKSNNSKYFEDIACPYTLAGIHISMAIQKLNKKRESNKGKTFLVFDEQKEYEDRLSELVYNPPKYIDEFVEFNSKKEKGRLSIIIDSAYFVKSHHSSMAQIADIASFFMRLYFELNYYGMSESYNGEKNKINNWVSVILKRAEPLNKLYAKNPRKCFLKFIDSVKANGIENLMKGNF